MQMESKQQRSSPLISWPATQGATKQCTTQGHELNREPTSSEESSPASTQPGLINNQAHICHFLFNQQSDSRNKLPLSRHRSSFYLFCPPAAGFSQQHKPSVSKQLHVCSDVEAEDTVSQHKQKTKTKPSLKPSLVDIKVGQGDSGGNGSLKNDMLSDPRFHGDCVNGTFRVKLLIKEDTDCPLIDADDD